jgi:hypothetical protein
VIYVDGSRNHPNLDLLVPVQDNVWRDPHFNYYRTAGPDFAGGHCYYDAVEHSLFNPAGSSPLLNSIPQSRDANIGPDGLPGAANGLYMVKLPPTSPRARARWNLVCFGNFQHPLCGHVFVERKRKP